MLCKIDDSDKPGIARVEIIGRGKMFMGKRRLQIRIVEIVNPSTFIKCKVGSIKTVVEHC